MPPPVAVSSFRCDRPTSRRARSSGSASDRQYAELDQHVRYRSPISRRCEGSRLAIERRIDDAEMDCFASLAMTARHLRILAAHCARVVHESFAPKWRAWGMPGARCTRSRVCKCSKAHALVTTVAPGSPGIPARNGFNGLFRALPGDRAFLPPSLGGIASANLTPASGRQDHTTSPSADSALVSSATRVHRIPALRS